MLDDLSQTTIRQTVLEPIPFVFMVAGVVLSLRAVGGQSFATLDGRAKSAARRWLGICALLIVLGPAVHGLSALGHHRPLPLDAAIGCWFLIPMIWFFFRWDRIWERIIVEGRKLGFPHSGPILLRLVTGGIVFLAYYHLLLSLLGIDVEGHSRFDP